MLFLTSLVYLLLGFVILVFSGDKLVESAVALARHWKISPAVIAVTLLAAGTSAPEFVTSLLAAFSNATDISLGNVIGSNIFNLMAVGGLALVVTYKDTTNKEATNKNSANKETTTSWWFLMLGSLCFLGLIFDLNLTRWEGASLLTLTALFIFISLKESQRKAPPQESTISSETPLTSVENFSLPKNLILVGGSLAGLILGAQAALKGGVALGQLYGLSERVIGITIISVGTGLPELATSVSAALKKQNDMALANIIGSNIYNTLAIPGATSMVFPMAINKQLIVPDSLFMIGATTALGAVFLFKKPMIGRVLGIGLLTSYGAYLFSLLARSI